VELSCREIMLAFATQLYGEPHGSQNLGDPLCSPNAYHSPGTSFLEHGSYNGRAKAAAWFDLARSKDNCGGCISHVLREGVRKNGVSDVKLGPSASSPDEMPASLLDSWAFACEDNCGGCISHVPTEGFKRNVVSGSKLISSSIVHSIVDGVELSSRETCLACATQRAVWRASRKPKPRIPAM
jgi:hypothetical protein